MEIMLHITSRDAGALATALMRALSRAEVSWGCFVTNDGAELLRDSKFTDALGGAGRAVVCEHSWKKLVNAPQNCPVEQGSQTINSTMMAEAERLVSL